MQQLGLLAGIQTVPEPADGDQAERGFHNLHDRAETAGGDVAAFARALTNVDAGRALLAAIFGNSPFLTQCLLRDLAFAQRLFEAGPDRARDDLLHDLSRRVDAQADQPSLMKELRIARNRCALLTAIADISGIWALDEITRTLSDFAEAALDITVDFVLRAAAEAGDLDLADHAHPSQDSGFTVLAMGKLGARELNFSSDIDLIVLYDQEVVTCTGGAAPQDLCVRATQTLVRILQDRTSEGYVFRTDLRLRPDPGATPIAVSMAAAENYYESVGQNWERAALIKARPVAGDRVAGAQFLARIAPFVWRKHLDYAAIADIHSIKRQINVHKGHSEIAVAGHDIKLGRGGIREIEFFAQTQQLIAGGRDPRLRMPATCEAIRALVATDRLAADVADELIAAYEFLRRLEHRLQMINDEQTHTLPTDGVGLKRLAVFMGDRDENAFAESLLDQLTRVVSHYAALFEHAPPLGPAGNLVFTGIEDDPETIETLERQGFREPSTVSARIRGWHHGRYRATRSVRAREILTVLVPRLLDAFAKTANPDNAFVKFDESLGKLPAGVQLFSLFYENPMLVDLVAEIMGSAPRLADYLSTNVYLFDAVLSEGFLDRLPDKAELAQELGATVAEARDFQDVLDFTRRRANENKFRAGVQVLRNAAPAHEVAPMLSGLADSLICALLPVVAHEFALAHGHIRGAEFAVVGLGKLGANELNSTSDLDLIFLYDAPPDVDQSDGAKPLATSHYFARLSQRLINALTALTGEGRLYEVDMRLRPAGAAGPIASHVDAFAHYQQDSAWTWEHMALTRARIVSASDPFAARIQGIIRGVLTVPRNAEAVRRDVAEMRDRIAHEHGTADLWEVKHVRGGLVDLQFLCQYLQLRHAREHPRVLHPGTAEAFRHLAAAGVLPAELAGDLIRATLLMHDVQGLLRLTVEGPFDEATASEGLQRALAQAGASENLPALREELARTQDWVHQRFREFIESAARGAGTATAKVGSE